MDKAIDYLREKGLSKAAKKASRVAAEGLVDIYLDEANKVAALVEVNCETDFVANTDDYKNLVHSITKHVALTKPADMQALLDSTFTGSDKKVSEIVTEAIAKIGEKLISAVSLSMNMAAIPWVTISMAQARLASSLNSKAAMKNWPNMLPCTLQLLTLATWIALLCRLMFWTMKRKFLLNRLATKANRKDHRKDGHGPHPKFYKENCLVDQEFVMDPDKTISGLLKEKNAKAIRFVRYQLGEGIEKKQEDFASEVQSFIK